MAFNISRILKQRPLVDSITVIMWLGSNYFQKPLQVSGTIGLYFGLVNV